MWERRFTRIFSLHIANVRHLSAHTKEATLSGNEFFLAALAATFGGAIGAVGTALLSWSQVRGSLDDVRQELTALGNSPDTQRLRKAVDKLWRDLGILSAALARLKELLRIR